MGSIWGRQDPGGPHVGPMNLAIFVNVPTLGQKLPHVFGTGSVPTQLWLIAASLLGHLIKRAFNLCWSKCSNVITAYLEDHTTSTLHLRDNVHVNNSFTYWKLRRMLAFSCVMFWLYMFNLFLPYFPHIYIYIYMHTLRMLHMSKYIHECHKHADGLDTDCQSIITRAGTNQEWQMLSVTCEPYWKVLIMHDDVIKWKHIPRYWPFVRSPVNSPHKGQWRGALMRFKTKISRVIYRGNLWTKIVVVDVTIVRFFHRQMAWALQTFDVKQTTMT